MKTSVSPWITNYGFVLSKLATPQTCDITACRFYHGGISGSPLNNYRDNKRARAINNFLNDTLTELFLYAMALLRTWGAGRRASWLYRLKEKCGIRL